MNGVMGGVTYFKQKINFDKSSIGLEIPKKGIPFGVLSITLTDENNREWAKRPVFIDASNTLNLTITSVAEAKGANELAFKVLVTDDNGLPVATDFSFSATQLLEATADGRTTELSGFAWYSNAVRDMNQNPERTKRFSADLELLTSEYWRFSQAVPNRINYPFQQGLDLFGYAYDLNNELLKNTKLQMLSTSDIAVQALEVETDAMGRIRVENLQLMGENKLVFRTKGEDTSSRLVKIVPLKKDLNKKTSIRMTWTLCQTP